MTNESSTLPDNLTYALHLIDKLSEPFLQHVAPLDAMRLRLRDLMGRTCTGNPHWRDKNASGKTAKLYILHRTDQDCPVHGKPAAGQRNRVYIGNKPDRIADALAAIERHKDRVALQRQHDNLARSIGRLTYQLKSLYRCVGYLPPEIGQDAQPIQPYTP